MNNPAGNQASRGRRLPLTSTWFDGNIFIDYRGVKCLLAPTSLSLESQEDEYGYIYRRRGGDRHTVP